MSRLYNDPGTTESGIGPAGGSQIRSNYYIKKALSELKKEQFFSQLADVTAMPKHFGKTIKRYHYMPLLDDRNVNDQGIDANGLLRDNTEWEVRFPALTGNFAQHVEALEASFAEAHSSGDVIFITDSSQWLLLTADTAVGYDASTTGGASGTEKSDAEIKAYIEADTADSGVTATVSNNSIVVDVNPMIFATEAAADMVMAIVGGAVKTKLYGNLYGSSKDVGTISAKLPALSETGGRVNRVGFTRIELTGTIEKFGFFDEYTKESMDFDTDAELMTHINREMIFGANEMTEDALQIDLLNGAGVIRYAGDATTNATLNGDGSTPDEVDYDDLMRLSITLDENRCPKQTKVITGSRMIDTKVINGARVMYIGSELQPTVEKMTGHFGSTDKAFIPVAHYADAGTILTGEIGTLGSFRIVVVPEMMHWAGAGADDTDNDGGYRTTNGRYDVYPMLVVGDASFTTIGFQTDGKTVKFKIKHVPPESDAAYSAANDPYGETGFMSIKWYYGTMILRSERIAILKTVAQL